jgi:hypothetical protein
MSNLGKSMKRRELVTKYAEVCEADAEIWSIKLGKFGVDER